MKILFKKIVYISLHSNFFSNLQTELIKIFSLKQYHFTFKQYNIKILFKKNRLH